MASNKIDTTVLRDAISSAQDEVVDQIGKMRDMKEGPGIIEMFDMQRLMTKLSQISEMSTSVVSAQNTSMMSMARNTKG
jgi:hypothetical protein